MKKIIILLTSVLAIVSCIGGTASAPLTKEDSIRILRDSFSNTIVNLSYNGIRIGANADSIDSLLLECGVYSTKNDGHFIQGRHEITYVDKDNKELRERVELQVDTIHNRIARISLLGHSYKLADYFVETFNIRYYENEPVVINKMGAYERRHNWAFRNSNIHVSDLYHIDPVTGIYHVHDAILIEYKDIPLSAEIDSIEAQRKEMENAAMESERKFKADRLRENI